jgi:hypothetical protein
LECGSGFASAAFVFAVFSVQCGRAKYCLAPQQTDKPEKQKRQRQSHCRTPKKGQNSNSAGLPEMR